MREEPVRDRAGLGQPWPVEHVVALAPTARALTAAEALADPRHWRNLGGDDVLLWGQCWGSAGEPYQTFVDHAVEAGAQRHVNQMPWACTCPSRQVPCKHALGLLLLWVRRAIGPSRRPPEVRRWAASRRRGADAPSDAATHNRSRDQSPEPDSGPTTDIGLDDKGRTDKARTDKGRNERVARMAAGLRELELWLADRVRAGLADPSMSDVNTWHALAARLVDAQVGALANRVKRVAALVGDGSDWHQRVLSEMGVLYLLARAGQRIAELPEPMADSVAIAVGWRVARTTVLDTAPESGPWFVAGRSDEREDRIEVRRWWLRSHTDHRWAMLLSFAAYGQSLDDSLRPGTVIDADVHRYPGSGLRALIGAYRHRADPPSVVSGAANATTVADACAQIGTALAHEPWLERYCATVDVELVKGEHGWALADATGSLVIHATERAIATMLAVGAPFTTTLEWSPAGISPLSVHLPDRTLDIARRAGADFVPGGPRS